MLSASAINQKFLPYYDANHNRESPIQSLVWKGCWAAVYIKVSFRDNRSESSGSSPWKSIAVDRSYLRKVSFEGFKSAAQVVCRSQSFQNNWFCSPPSWCLVKERCCHRMSDYTLGWRHIDCFLTFLTLNVRTAGVTRLLCGSIKCYQICWPLWLCKGVAGWPVTQIRAG